MDQPLNESPPIVKIYLCFEPDQQICAERIDGWPATNSDFAAYNKRLEYACDAPGAEILRQSLSRQIHESDVMICIISGTTQSNPWINWELEIAKAASPRKGLVGILLKDHVEPPAAMVNSGSIFISFRKDAVERAVLWAMEEERSNEDYTLQDD